jgi:hypothetical protein
MSNLNEAMKENSELRKRIFELETAHKTEREKLTNYIYKAEEQLYILGETVGSQQAQIRNMKADLDEMAAHIEELLPFLKSEVDEGLKFGLDDSYHPDDGCDQCLSYRWARIMDYRIRNNEFTPNSSHWGTVEVVKAVS